MPILNEIRDSAQHIIHRYREFLQRDYQTIKRSPRITTAMLPACRLFFFGIVITLPLGFIIAPVLLPIVYKHRNNKNKF